MSGKRAQGLRLKALEGTVLGPIAEAALRRAESLPAVTDETVAAAMAAPRGASGLREALSRPGRRFILEVKAASPSLGVIRSDIDLEACARAYARHADAVSVLTEPTAFGGSFGCLARMRALTTLPILAKDVTVDERQILAARAALISGAGRVTLECRAEHAPHVDMVYPEIMFATKPVNLEDFDAIVLGCGLGTSAEAKARVIEALNCQKPLILDADALNIIAADIKLQDMVLARRAPTVLTPHPGEAARLLRRDTAGVTADRVAACRELAVQTGAIVVLKGAGTVIWMRSSRTWINPTGSPMLATGGSGDVLAGMIGAMFAQGYDMVESVLAAVYFHGLSAEGLEAGFTAGEIAPNAMALVHDARVSYDL